MNYTSFISELFHCIEPLLPAQRNPLVAFCSAMPIESGWCIQDSALLMNDCAEFYLRVIRKNKDVFQIKGENYMSKPSLIRKGETRYNHSCYPKNVRRWLQGTLSRKKECRVQFCTFLYCWATGWGNPGVEHEKCQQELRKICKSYFPEVSEELDLLSLFWTTLETVYMSVHKQEIV